MASPAGLMPGFAAMSGHLHQPEEPQALRFAPDLTVDLAQRAVRRGGIAVELTPSEWLLLDLLITARGAPVSSDLLLGLVWGPAYREDGAYLAVRIWWLRQKLETDPAHPVLVLSSSEGAYRLNFDLVTAVSS
jgi:DNA-binding response OmpR family regulator